MAKTNINTVGYIYLTTAATQSDAKLRKARNPFCRSKRSKNRVMHWPQSDQKEKNFMASIFNAINHNKTHLLIHFNLKQITRKKNHFTWFKPRVSNCLFFFNWVQIQYWKNTQRPTASPVVVVLFSKLLPSSFLSDSKDIKKMLHVVQTPFANPLDRPPPPLLVSTVIPRGIAVPWGYNKDLR